MRKNSYDRILKREPKEQHLSTIPKSTPKHALDLTTNKNNT